MRTFLGAEGTRAFLETVNRKDCDFLANTFTEPCVKWWKNRAHSSILGFFSKEQSIIQVSNFLYPSIKLPISKPFCMRHQPELSYFVCKLFTIQMLNRTCRTGPLLPGIHHLPSTASSQSKVSQSTVMSCLTDSSYTKAER